MLRVTQAELSRYRREVGAQADKARDYFRRAIAEFMRRYPDATTEDTRVFVLDLMGSALPNFTDLTGTLACDLFDELAEEVGFEGERARLYETTDWQIVDRKVHYLAGFLNEGDKERFKSEVSDLTHYCCKRAAYDNMVANCRGQRVKWARVPTGLETCAYCFMLASRGFAYLSERSAAEGRHGYHDNCDCVVVPGFEGPDGNPRVKVDGYDPEVMYRNWLSCAKTVGIDKHADPMSGVWTDDERRAVRREVATRDWHWLYTGKEPKLTYESAALMRSKEKRYPHEVDTASCLRQFGITTNFVEDGIPEVDKNGKKTGRVIGYADLGSGFELKTTETASSYNTINGYLKNTSKKKNARCVVFDNRGNDSMSDGQLVEWLNRSQAFRRGRVYIIDHEGGYRFIR